MADDDVAFDAKREMMGKKASHDDNDDENDDQNDSDSMSDDDSSSSEEEEESEGKIAHLEQEIKTNLYLYEPHVELITLLRKEGDLDRLRVARERMSQIYPLTEKLWMAWLQDEEKLAATNAERDAVQKLFERAVQDYLSVEVWLEYVQFSIGQMGAKDGLNNIRQVFERALSATGLHVTKGSLIWEAYREFENALFNTLQLKPDEDLNSSLKEETEQQKQRVYSIFRRQLTTPLIGMERTYEEFLDWLEDSPVDKTVTALHGKTLAKLKKLQPYEDSLLSSNPPHLEAYERYLEFELKENEPARVQCLFERALADNCLIPDLWKKYTDYLEKQLQMETISLPAYERAIRNCPWSVDLWQNYVLAMERYKQPHEKIKELVDRALGAGFTMAAEFRQLWTIYLEYLRRRIDWTKDDEQNPEVEELRSTFLRAHNHLVEYFGEEADSTASILRYWARIEGRYCKNMEKARELWSEILLPGKIHSAEIWLEYIYLERACGESQHLRKLYQKALQAVTDWPEMIGESWINFERDEGSLKQCEVATAKINARMQIIKDRRNKAKAQPHFEPPEKDKLKSVKSNLKRKLQRKEEAAAKRPKWKKEDDEKSRIDKEGFKIPQASMPGKWENLGKSIASSSTKAKETPQEARERISHNSSKDDITVFLSNLDYSVDENAIKEKFSKAGEVSSVRLVRDYKGRSKGYCYLEFKTKESQQAALKMDRELINERPVFVSPCKDKRGPANDAKFKYPLGLEKNKLFVRGLPFSANKEDLVALFKPFGELLDIRIVTYRNGHSKGLAYVDFKDETAAAMALVKLDGSQMENQTINVALSHPPDRGKASGQEPNATASLGGGTREVGARGRGRTQVALLPRALQKKQSEGASSRNSSNGTENGRALPPTEAPKTNEDFRNMLFK